MATILVTDGNERSALAVVRSLGRAGHRVIVGASPSDSLAGTSRFASARIALPDSLARPAEFATAVDAACRSAHPDLILPVADASIIALQSMSTFRDKVLSPPLETFLRISDKAEVTRVAESLDVRVPRQAYLVTPDDARNIGAFEGEVVLKPTRSVRSDAAARSKQRVIHASDWAGALRALRQLPASAFPLLAQERVVGPGIGVFLLVWRGELRASFAHRRIREKPPSGGVSVVCESVDLDSRLRDQSVALVRAFDWSGVAMVEYKRDLRTGEAVLMEINGRFWGSLQLAIDAGVDFPALLVDSALGRTPQPVTSWRSGVRSRWFWGDADHLLARLRHSAADLHLPPDAPGRLRALGGFIAASLRPWNDQVVRLSDVRPALRELRNRLGLSPWSARGE